MTATLNQILFFGINPVITWTRVRGAEPLLRVRPLAEEPFVLGRGRVALVAALLETVTARRLARGPRRPGAPQTVDYINVI